MGGNGAYVYLFSQTEENGECTPLFFEMNKEEIQVFYSALYEERQFLPFGKQFINANDILQFKIHESSERPFRTV